jgi:hypothetical protein
MGCPAPGLSVRLAPMTQAVNPQDLQRRIEKMGATLEELRGYL